MVCWYNGKNQNKTKTSERRASLLEYVQLPAPLIRGAHTRGGREGEERGSRVGISHQGVHGATLMLSCTYLGRQRYGRPPCRTKRPLADGKVVRT